MVPYQDLLSELKKSNSPKSSDSRERVLEDHVPGVPGAPGNIPFRSDILSTRTHSLRGVHTTRPWQLNLEPSGVPVPSLVMTFRH